jgi:hypothetical protein
MEPKRMERRRIRLWLIGHADTTGFTPHPPIAAGRLDKQEISLTF